MGDRAQFRATARPYLATGGVGLMAGQTTALTLPSLFSFTADGLIRLRNFIRFSCAPSLCPGQVIINKPAYLRTSGDVYVGQGDRFFSFVFL